MRDYFFLRINGKCVKIFFKELQYVEALNKFIKFVTDKKSYLACGCLYHVENWLPPDEFCRIHRSYIISLRHINEFTSDIVSIAGRDFPIGKQYRNDFSNRVEIVSAERPPMVRDSDKNTTVIRVLSEHSSLLLALENLLTK